MSTVLGPFDPSMLSRVLGAARGDEDYDVGLSKEAQAISLRDFNERYQNAMLNPPRFKAGDMVTPIKGVGTKGAGNPHVVLEVRSFGSIEPYWSKDASSSGNGRRLDIRVACFVHGESVSTFWVESIEYEPYTD